MKKYVLRRLSVFVVALIGLTFIIIQAGVPDDWLADGSQEARISADSSSALHMLESLEVKGRAPKTGYSRDQFGSGWSTVSGCNTRNIILNRDLKNVVLDDKCNVVSGILDDPYTGKQIIFERGVGSNDIQIDHVVALSDAWQKGAQNLSFNQRTSLANDPLNLLAVDGSANQQKSDGDSATWLPSNRAFRCQYVARQIEVKSKYSLWVTKAEKTSMINVLNKC